MINTSKIKNFLGGKEIPDFQSGDIVKVTYKSEEEQQKPHIFEGQVLERKHGEEMGATATIRSEILGTGVEMTFPLHSPKIEDIEVIRKKKARRSKLQYLRNAKGRKANLKDRE